MQGVDLTWADLTRCNLAGADLYEADLRAANLADADLTDANLRDAVYNDSTRWPNGFDPCPRGAVRVGDPINEHDGCAELVIVGIASFVVGAIGGFLYARHHHAPLDWMISNTLLGAVLALLLGVAADLTLQIATAPYRQPRLE